MAATYPYDPDVRERVAKVLYELLPSLYRVRDEPPAGTEDLRRFLEVLAAPLAAVRQNIEELHADLFIDSAAGWVLPYLADMVGAELIFPDEDSNRRDLRGTVAWRRRKGTPRTLEEMGGELSGQVVATHEGWQRLLVVQDLNLLRRERTLPLVRDPILAEIATGPLDGTFHLVDARVIGERTGRYHPKHVTHYMHPTELFPLRGAVPAILTKFGDADLRYAFHFLGESLPLRLAPDETHERIATDRVPAMSFARNPGRTFGTPGGFEVRLAGLSGGVAEPSIEPRHPSRTAASDALLDGPAIVELLEHNADRLTGPVAVELFAVPIPGGAPGVPDDTAAVIRGGISIDANGGTALASGNANAPNAVAMLRLKPQAPATAAYFPGAVVAITAASDRARLEAEDEDLAREGFLRGALHVRIPGTWIRQARWFLLAADGSLFEAQSTGEGAVDATVDVVGGKPTLLSTDVRSAGPGAAWPPTEITGSPEAFTQVPSARWHAPVVLHGRPTLLENAGVFSAATPADDVALVFAARHRDGGPAAFEPFCRLEWSGPDPASATWTAVATNGVALPASGVGVRFRNLAELRELAPPELQLAVRLEGSVADLVLPPSEVAYMADDGGAVLVHLPRLQTRVANPDIAWALGDFAAASEAVVVNEDGSTRMAGTVGTVRFSHGAVAPLLGPAPLRRRRVKQRSLCQWFRETVAKKHVPTRAGRLDIDPTHGLFSLAKEESPPALPVGPDGAPPASPFTVDLREGYTDHVGARPAPREVLLGRRQLVPTRLVSAEGRISHGAPAAWHGKRLYRTVAAALADIAADPAPAEHEVIEFQDSATYDESIAWPAGPKRITWQASENERPVILCWAWAIAPGVSYEGLTLRGVALGHTGAAPQPLNVPPANEVAIELVTILRGDHALAFSAPPEGGEVRVARSVTAGLELAGAGTLRVEDSVVHAVANAVRVPDGTFDAARVTVVGDTECFVLEATDSILLGDVTVRDRFHGCVRYSRVPAGAVLPRKHRVAEGTMVRFVTLNRFDPAHMRLAHAAAAEILHGAEDGSEMGAFHQARLGQRTEALRSRFVDFTPAGLQTGLIRKD